MSRCWCGSVVCSSVSGKPRDDEFRAFGFSYKPVLPLDVRAFRKTKNAPRLLPIPTNMGVFRVRYSSSSSQDPQFIKNTKGTGASCSLLKKFDKFKVQCARGPFQNAWAESLMPLWKEGLFFVRCTVFMAVVSVAGALTWYAQLQARGFVEAHLLPAACAALSEYLQRELDVGKVKSVSPLGVTLHACTIGPHQEEFSCGEVPVMKLHVRPFASLRRGKVVVDAVLSQPCLLVAQKKDFSWLGIPPPSEISHVRHSSEEGIDYRTKSRRLAREAMAAQWAAERDKAAQGAAEAGYIVPEECPVSDVGSPKDHDSSKTEKLKSVLFADQLSHQKMDHHCIGSNLDYNSKHASLEKSFGMASRANVQSKLVPDFRRPRNNRKKVISYADNSSRQRILKRSALAATAYFQGLASGSADSSSEAGSSNFEGTEGAVYGETPTKMGPDLSAMGLSSNGATRTCYQDTNCSAEVNRTHLEIPTDHYFNPLDGDEGKETVRMEHQNHSSSEGTTSKLRNGFSLGSTECCKHLLKSDELPSLQHTPVCDAETSCHKLLHTAGNWGDSFFNENPSNMHQESISGSFGSCTQAHQLKSFWPCTAKDFPTKFNAQVNQLSALVKKLKPQLFIIPEDISEEILEGVDEINQTGFLQSLPVSLDSVYFMDGTLMLLGYGDQEPREVKNVNGHVKLKNHYGRIHVHLSGNCMEWRQERTSQGGGLLTTDVFVDLDEQNWHANLNITDLFAPLFECLLEIPITWRRGRATGEVHICMSKTDTFPNLHGQLDVKGLHFQILEAPSWFSDLTASLSLRGQRVFLHNTSGWFGDAPLEASGDFGINPEDGEFHLMCQVPSVEINALMKTLKMRPLMFPLAGFVTAVFNCQGPLDAPVFVGSGIISRKSLSVSKMPPSVASETVEQNKEAGAVAAIDRIPFSHVSANFTFNLDNCVADMYGIRACLLDSGEIRGAGNAWVCAEGEVDDGALDVNLSGSFPLEKVLHRYVPGGIKLIPLKIGELNGETRLSGSLLRPKFDIKCAAPNAEDSFADARGNIIITHDYFAVTTSSVAFDLNSRFETSYIDDYWLLKDLPNMENVMPFVIEGVDFDLRMRGFEFASISTPLDSPRPSHLKATGRVKFQGKVHNLSTDPDNSLCGIPGDNANHISVEGRTSKLVGQISFSGLKLNQLTLAPQSSGSLSISHDSLVLNTMGRPDEKLLLEIAGPMFRKEAHQDYRVISVTLQKGQLKASSYLDLENVTNLEIRNLPLDELELASLRGLIQKAELELNFQKRKGHGVLSVLHPKFSGVLGEALDVAARWSGDVITLEKSVLEQARSKYELQGEYVLSGTRDRFLENQRDSYVEKAMAGHLGNIMSSMGRWRMRLEVPHAEVGEMLPLARLLSRSTDPAVRSRSKDLFMQSLLSAGFSADSLQDQLKAIRTYREFSQEDMLDEIDLPGLAELTGRWNGSLDARGGGNGDTLADFDFHGEDWEWGTYKTQRVLVAGSYSNNDGLHLEKLFIQKDNATLHADGTVLGPISNLHFAVLNFPVGLIPTLAQVIESSSLDFVQMRQLLAPIKGILHMEGDLRGSLAKPECDIRVRLLDGTVGGIDLGRAEVLASVTPSSRFVFNANIEPVIQSGHVNVQGSIPVTYVGTNLTEDVKEESNISHGAIQIPVWFKEKGSTSNISERRIVRERAEDGWDFQLAESLKGLNWDTLNPDEVRMNADIKDGGMMLLTALSPYANWLHGYADVILQVKGTVSRPVIDGSASFHRASVSSPFFRTPLTNLGGTLNIISNRLCISSLESRVNRKGRLSLKGNLPLTEASDNDKIELKCENLEVRAKNILSGQVDSQLQIEGSILRPNISGMIRLSRGEAYIPPDKGNSAVSSRVPSSKANFLASGFDQDRTSGEVSRFLRSLSSSENKQADGEKSLEQESFDPRIDAQLTGLKLKLGPELKIIYPLILSFAVSGDLELDGMAHPKYIRPKGTLTFENGEVNLVATQVRLKKDHQNIAKFEPDLGLDPVLDLILVGTEWQFRIQGRASSWQDNLVVTSTRSVDQDVLSPTEAAKVFESQLAESLLEGDGQLAFRKLATATLATLMPRIEGKGEFGQARWRMVYAPQIPSLLSVDPTVDPLKSLANNISFATEVELQLGKRLQASVVRQMKDSEMAMQWSLIYQLTSRLRVLFQSTPSNRLLFEYSATSQD